MKEAIRLRGCNEEFIADPALLTEGKVWETYRIDQGCIISPPVHSDCLLRLLTAQVHLFWLLELAGYAFKHTMHANPVQVSCATQ